MGDQRMTQGKRKGLLERLAGGVVVGDGGFCFALEKRGYVKVGVWTPECTVRHPDAVRQLHRDFLRAGADVMQAFNYNCSESKLTCSADRLSNPLPPGRDINLAAYRLAREVADEGDALVTFTITEPMTARAGASEEQVKAELRDQIQFFVDEKCDLDFVACEYHARISEMEWAIAVCKEFGLVVAATMCIGPTTDQEGVSVGECAVRMARAGAEVVGVNCNFGPPTCLETIRLMKAALDREGLTPYLMTQPLGFLTPDVNSMDGHLNLPGHFLAYEPRTCTRFEMQKYAREAYELGVRYIGGCCGTEPYHVRAISEELTAERQKVAAVTEEYGDILSGVRDHARPAIKARSSAEYWKNFKPNTGRPESSAFAPSLLTQ